MSEPRICPECGSDIYRASHYQELLQARDRHWRTNQSQAIEILRLQLRVAELEDERRYRGGKVERQRRTIVRLQEKLRALSSFPHDNKPLGEGDPVSPAGKHTLAPGKNPSEDMAKFYSSPRGIRKVRKQKKQKEDSGD